MCKKIIELAIYISSILLAASVFLPLTKLPIYGVVTYHRIFVNGSYLVILFAISALVLLLIRKYKYLILLPVAVWITLLFPALKSLTKSGNTGFYGRIGKSISSAMSDFAGHLFLNIADFSWGGYIFLISLLVFTVSCIFRSLKK